MICQREKLLEIVHALGHLDALNNYKFIVFETNKEVEMNILFNLAKSNALLSTSVADVVQNATR